MKKILIAIFFIGILFLIVKAAVKNTSSVVPQSSMQFQEKFSGEPLVIATMRKRAYPGSDLAIEQTLAAGGGYNQYIASYTSDGLKIYGLLTVPQGEKPANGWPVIIFNHGYIPPEQYRTTERYVAYVDGFARNGFIVFKPDYRGHGKSEGKPEGAYYSSAYAIDVLNAVSSIKKFKDADPSRIGMWGHSMGGNITLRVMVVSKDVKASVIWSGVVGTYEELLTKWRRTTPWQPSAREIESHITSIRQNLIQKYGSPSANFAFWQAIDPRYHLTDISGPLQLHQGLADEEVPVLFSEHLRDDLVKLGKTVEYYTYSGEDHNISGPGFAVAMERSIEFFTRYLKK